MFPQAEETHHRGLQHYNGGKNVIMLATFSFF